MTQQCLEVSQLVVRGLVEGDPEREPLGRERRDLGSLGLNAPRGALLGKCPSRFRQGLGAQGR